MDTSDRGDKGDDVLYPLHLLPRITLQVWRCPLSTTTFASIHLLLTLSNYPPFTLPIYKSISSWTTMTFPVSNSSQILENAASEPKSADLNDQCVLLLKDYDSTISNTTANSTQQPNAI